MAMVIAQIHVHMQYTSLVTTNSDKTKAELIWALKYIESGYSDNSNTDMNVVFKCMFPDSKLLVLFKWDQINCIIM